MEGGKAVMFAEYANRVEDSGVKAFFLEKARAFGHFCDKSEDWLSFLGGFDPRSIERYRIEDIVPKMDWVDTLHLVYHLFLGRLPEFERIHGDSKSAYELFYEILLSDEFAGLSCLLRLVRGPAFNQRPRLIHLHVPRTGGTALASAMRHASSTGHFGLYEMEMATVETLNLLASASLSTHFPRKLFPRKAGHTYVAFLRDPVERFLSRVNFYFETGALDLAEFEKLPAGALLERMLQFAPLLEEHSGRYQNNAIDLPATRGDQAADPLHLAPFEALPEILQFLGVPAEQAPMNASEGSGRYADVVARMVRAINRDRFSAEERVYGRIREEWRDADMRQLKQIFRRFF